ncbi:MAG: phenylalanine--tRNA ligase subunit beta [Clostridia bacterium]|nr:phenylalanine--tRNA ligase subunit beta [Clostridia bacterium]
MKLPMQWIRDYAELPTSVAEYTERMIMTGTAVEGTETLGGEISGVVTGKICSMQKHPNSDHLWICQVDIGGKRPIQIVTGAQNLSGGEIVPVCVDGATLPGGKTIKTGKLRGELSEGMLCGGSELGVDDHLYPGAGIDGILIFREELPLGHDALPLLGLGDTVIDFDILANRPDCQCVFGIARESAAVFNVPFQKPAITVTETGGNVLEEAKVDVLDAELCPRYTARVIRNVRIGPSPLWLRAYLHGAGMRSINNIVDITNFVMLETGHPMHAFDLAKVRGRHIIVRRAHPDETLRTLDGKAHILTQNMLVIADETGAVGLAGIMGGEESEITDDTQEILFECAAFDRATTRVTARALGIRTESSARFEKGVTAATAMEALDRACQLVCVLNAGDVVSGAIDVYPSPYKAQVVEASVSGIQRRTGVKIPAEEIEDILTRLHFDVVRTGDALTVTVPAFRQDIDGYADLSEEALRFYGYHHLQSTLPVARTVMGRRSPLMRLTDTVRRVLAGAGALETVSFSFVSPEDTRKLGLPAGDPRLIPVVIRNPLGEDSSAMRTSLVPAILRQLSLNQHRQTESAMLFELGTVFEDLHREPGALPREPHKVCLGAYGGGIDFYGLRDIAAAILAAFRIPYAILPESDAYYHPGRSATLLAGDMRVCTIGELHPDAAAAFDLTGRVCIAEVDVDALERLQRPIGDVKPLPRFPAVTRDIALVLAEAQPVGPVLDTIREVGGPLLAHVEVFDIYRGIQAGSSKKSIAFALQFRADDRTLTDEETTALLAEIVGNCAAQYGAEIRK